MKQGVPEHRRSAPAMLMAAISGVPISKSQAFTGRLAAIVSFGLFVFDSKLKRIGTVAGTLTERG